MNISEFTLFLKKFFFNKFIQSKEILLLSFFLTFSVIAYYNLNLGPIMSPDTVVHYSKWADSLIDLNFNLIAFYYQNPFVAPTYFYTIPLILMAFTKLIFGSQWQEAFMILNLSFIFFSLIIFIKGLRLLGVRNFFISLTMPLMIISADLMTYPRWILTDTFYSFIVILITFIIIKEISYNKSYLKTLIFLILIIILSRPAFMPIIVAVFLFKISLRFKIYKYPKLVILLILILFLIGPMLFASAHQFFDLIFEDSTRVNRVLSRAEKGIVIWDRPSTWIDPPNSFLEFSYLYFLRLINFFNPYASSFSYIHIILNIFLFLVILLSIFIWFNIGGTISSIDKSVFFILLLSLSVASFHAFILLDYDWRYRYPLILPLLMLFPISMEVTLQKKLK